VGVFGDIIKTIKEAVEEAQAQAEGRPVARGGNPVPSDQQVPDLEADLRAAQQRVRSKGKEKPRGAAEDYRLRQNVSKAAAVVKRQRDNAAQQAHLLRPGDPRRLAHLMRQPGSLREMIVLKELLDRPLALRRGRR